MLGVYGLVPIVPPPVGVTPIPGITPLGGGGGGGAPVNAGFKDPGGAPVGGGVIGLAIAGGCPGAPPGGGITGLGATFPSDPPYCIFGFIIMRSP
jgi:hypothetical protein